MHLQAVIEETVGQYLRRQREEKAVSLETVVLRTRIQIGFLEAIEGDQLDRIPHSVSVKGFIRSYAQFLQLDPAEALKRCPTLGPPEPAPIKAPGLYKESPVDMGQVGKPASLGSSFSHLLKTSLQGIAGIVLLALFLAWLSYWNRVPVSVPKDSGSHPPTIQSVAPHPPESPSAVGTEDVPAASLPNAGEETAQAVNTLVLLPTLQPVVGKRIPATEGVTPPRLSPKVSVRTLVKPARVAPPSSPPETEKPLDPPAPPPNPASTPTVIDPLVLLLEANASTWVKVLIDQRTVKDVLLQPGDKVAWQASEKFLLTVGNAGGVRAFFNGQDLGVLGNANEVMRDRLLMRSPVEPSEPVNPSEKEEPL